MGASGGVGVGPGFMALPRERQSVMDYSLLSLPITIAFHFPLLI